MRIDVEKDRTWMDGMYVDRMSRSDVLVVDILTASSGTEQMQASG